MRKISSVIMACAMCLSMAVVGTVAPKVAVQAEVTAEAELKEAPTETPKVSDYLGQSVYYIQYTEGSANTSAWVEKITSIKVNDTDYKKVGGIFSLGTDGYSVNAERANITLASAAFTKDINKVAIFADGYKTLVLEVGKNYSSIAIHTTHTGGAATCLKKAVCDFCGEEYGDLADHTYGDTYKTDGKYHWKECEVCGQETEKEAHKGGTATTTKKAVCDVCGAAYGDLKKETPKPAATTTVKNNTKPAKKTVKAKKVVVNKKSIVLKKGKKAKIKVKLVPAKATEKVTFKTSNKKVAKVTKSGVVKAVKKGKCKITVKTASGKKAVVKVTVK